MGDKESLQKNTPANRGVAKKGRTTPLDFEGLKSSFEAFVNLSICLSKSSTHPTIEKRVYNTKKRGLQPEKSGGGPASACENFFHFVENLSTKNRFWGTTKPESPHEY